MTWRLSFSPSILFRPLVWALISQCVPILFSVIATCSFGEWRTSWTTLSLASSVFCYKHPETLTTKGEFDPFCGQTLTTVLFQNASRPTFLDLEVGREEAEVPLTRSNRGHSMAIHRTIPLGNNLGLSQCCLSPPPSLTWISLRLQQAHTRLRHIFLLEWTRSWRIDLCHCSQPPPAHHDFPLCLSWPEAMTSATASSRPGMSLCLCVKPPRSVC